MNRKKIIAIHSDFPTSKTGLARNCKALMKYLVSTHKYDIRLFSTGIQWSNPDTKKLPVICRGALPDNKAELAQIQSNPGKLRDATYGELRIDRFIEENKPDIMVFSNDSWAFTSYLKKAWWNKLHCLPHITIDSTPLLKEQVEMAKSSKQMFVWAKFAKEEMEKLGVNNTEVIPAAIEDENFYPLPSNKKLELRKKFGISPDCFLTGFVFRSQPRKEIKPLLEGFALFKKTHPEVNAKLLLHTNFSEGWDIPRLMKDCGVAKEDVLTTYVCQQCGEYEVKPFDGQDQDCRFCGYKKSQITCGTLQGVREEQLNEVYNLMDCYCHLANAGGCEMPVIEALYCGLPVGTVPYSFGKTFTDESFVTTIDCAYTVQPQTLFNRAVPYPFSVAKFLKKIYGMDQQKRAEIGKKGREFALNNFSVQVVGKQWEKVFDELPLVEYDFSERDSEKNPSYPMPQGCSDNEFLTLLYDNMLLQPEPEDGEGRKHWLDTLSKGATREQVYQFFVKVAEEHNKKIKKVELTEVFDQERDTLLLVNGGSAEDVIISTYFLESARNLYPTHKIYFAVKPENASILYGNSNVDEIINYSPIFENELTMLSNGDNKGVVSQLISFRKIFKSESAKLGYQIVPVGNSDNLGELTPYLQTR